MSAIDAGYIDFALAMIGVEALALLAWRARTGKGPAPRALIANLTAGAGLLLVARALLTGAGALATLAPLTLALAAHILDIAARWEGASTVREADSSRCLKREGAPSEVKSKG